VQARLVQPRPIQNVIYLAGLYLISNKYPTPPPPETHVFLCKTFAWRFCISRFESKRYLHLRKGIRVIHVVNKDPKEQGFFASNRVILSTFCRKSVLKIDAPGKFQAARPRAFGGLQRSDGAESGRINLHVGRLVVAMVEDIGRFKPELELALLRER